MQVWDTAGQKRFRTITQSYYRSAHGAMIAYDISRRATFESVLRWLHELQCFGASSVLMVLIGNKRDLEAEREVQFCKLVEEQGMLAALETSAREARSVTPDPAALVLLHTNSRAVTSGPSLVPVLTAAASGARSHTTPVSIPVRYFPIGCLCKRARRTSASHLVSSSESRT